DSTACAASASAAPRNVRAAAPAVAKDDFRNPRRSVRWVLMPRMLLQSEPPITLPLEGAPARQLVTRPAQNLWLAFRTDPQNHPPIRRQARRPIIGDGEDDVSGAGDARCHRDS